MKKNLRGRERKVQNKIKEKEKGRGQLNKEEH